MTQLRLNHSKQMESQQSTPARGEQSVVSFYYRYTYTCILARMINEYLVPGGRLEHVLRKLRALRKRGLQHAYRALPL